MKRKLSEFDQIPYDVRMLLNKVAKRFMEEEIDYRLTKKYLSHTILKSLLVLTDGNLYAMSKRLGISYSTLYGNAQKMKSDLGKK